MCICKSFVLLEVVRGDLGLFWQFVNLALSSTEGVATILTSLASSELNIYTLGLSY